MSMNSSWLPTWLEVCWIVAYAAVALVHLWHAWRLRALGRLWHLSHILMALGMVNMFWPPSMPVAAHSGEIVFAAAAVLAATIGGYAAALRGAGWRLWLVTTVDLAGMVYMFAMMSHRAAPLTLALVLWSVGEALLWATGYAFTLLRVDEAAVGSAGADADAPGSEHAGAPASEHGWDLRVTLTAMTLGMAYMFLAMQYGMPAMDRGPGMPDMHMPNMNPTPKMSMSPSAAMSGMPGM